MQNLKYIVSIVLFMSSVDAFANVCNDDPKNQNQWEVSDCLTKMTKIQESKLNKIYTEKYAGSEYDAGFTAAQIAWKKYRDKQCDSEVEGMGSGGALVGGACFLELTTQRVQYLTKK